MRVYPVKFLNHLNHFQTKSKVNSSLSADYIPRLPYNNIIYNAKVHYLHRALHLFFDHDDGAGRDNEDASSPS